MKLKIGDMEFNVIEAPHAAIGPNDFAMIGANVVTYVRGEVRIFTREEWQRLATPSQFNSEEA